MRIFRPRRLKTTACIATIVSLLATPPLSAIAHSPATSRPAFDASTVVAHTIDDHGIRVPDKLLVGKPHLVTLGGRPQFAVTVGYFALPLAHATVRQGDPSIQECQQDGSFSTQVCATIYFSIDRDSAGQNFLYAGLVSYKSTASRLDSQVQLKNLLIQGSVGGPACGGKNFPLGTHQGWNVLSPTSGYAYSETPYWTNYFVELNARLTFGQERNDILTWTRGSATYTTRIIFYIPDSGFTPTGSCH